MSKRKEIASPAAEELRRQVTVETPSSSQRRNEVPEQSPKSAAAWALSILCRQPHTTTHTGTSNNEPQHPQTQTQPPPAVNSYSQHPPMPYHHPWQEYPPYHESPYMAKRLKLHSNSSPHYPEQRAMPPPGYAPSPYHYPSHHPTMPIYSEANRSFAQSPSMVTPTPKKHSYSRKNKSLGLLCENFIQTYNTSQVAISIDDAARALGVERRRIYDVINIFESLDIVSRKCKNTYNWLGVANLNKIFGKLQQEAFLEFPQDAIDHGLLYLSPEELPNRAPVQKKSLGRLSQHFLQLFLVGHPVMALTDASDKILGASSFEELAALANKEDENNPKTGRELQQAATRGLKTKIRRLYDIANVFVALGIIKKLEQPDRKCKPTFQWVHPKSAKEIRDDHVFVQTSLPFPSPFELSTVETPAPVKAAPTPTGTPTAAPPTAAKKPSGTPVSHENVLAQINADGAQFAEPLCRTVSHSSSEFINETNL